MDHLASDPSASTGVAVIDVDRRAENSIIVIGGANLAVSAADIDAAKPALQLARVLLLQLETPLAANSAAARLMRSAGGVVILDPAPAPVGGLDDEVLRAVDIVSPNETETESLVGIHPTTSPEAAEAASRLLARGAPTAIVKMGAHGVFFRNSDSEGFRARRSPSGRSTASAPGIASMAASRWRSPAANSLPDAVRFAAACGAVATTGPGGAGSAPTLEAVERLMSGGP